MLHDRPLRMTALECNQCGVAIVTRPEIPPSEPVFCCHGCRIVSTITGGRSDGGRSWQLLRVAAAGLLSMNVMMISLLLYTGSVEQHLVTPLRYVMLPLSFLSLAIVLPPFVSGAAGEIRSGRFAIDTLVVTGALAAFAVSVIHTIRHTGHVYYDTATMLPVLLAFGHFIESGAKARTLRLLRSLDDLLPGKVLLIGHDDTDHEVPLSAVESGDLIRIRPGERVGADGVIVEGGSTLEEAHLTGEPLPRFATIGDEVLAGGVNGPGTVVVRVKNVGEQLLVKRIALLIEKGRLEASPSMRIAGRFAAIFVPIILVVAVLSGGYWWWVGSPETAGLSVLAVLAVACPCALGIATPLATTQAVARAARRGVIVRGGEALEHLAGIDTLFIDKTGTLTSGTPYVAKIDVVDEKVSEDELIAWLAPLEAGTGHIFARAVLAEKLRRGLPDGTVNSLVFLPRGVSGSVTIAGKTRRVTVGRCTDDGADRGRDDGEATIIEVSWNGGVRGRIEIRDSLRKETPGAIAALSALGVHTVLVSGDRLATAEAAAREAGIREVEAPRTPEQKALLVKMATGMGRKVAMVGDGVNDAPALAAASVGIALGGGAEITRISGSIVLLSDRIENLPWLVLLSRRMRRIIVQNLAWTFCYNGIAVTAAAAGLLHPLLAVVAMTASSLTVIGNSVRLHRFPGVTEISSPAGEGSPERIPAGGSGGEP